MVSHKKGAWVASILLHLPVNTVAQVQFSEEAGLFVLTKVSLGSTQSHKNGHQKIFRIVWEEKR